MNEMNMVLCLADKKLEKKRRKEEEREKREAILNGLLIDVANAFQVDIEIAKSRYRQQLVVLVRRIFCYISRQLTDYGYISLAEISGLNDHATCIYHVRKVEGYFRKKDHDFLALWNHYLKHSKLFTKKDFI